MPPDSAQDDPNFIAILLDYIDPTSVFGMGYDVAWQLFPIASFILAFAILFRSVQEQYTIATTNNSLWSIFFMDVFLWGTLLVLYFLLSIPIIEFFNMLYKLTGDNGSLNAITLEVAQTVEKINAMPDSASPLEDNLLGRLLDTGAGFLMYGGAWLLYLFTFMIVLFVSSFLEICHAFFFNIAFIWGLFAIPMSITNNIKLLRPWATGLAIIMLWPVFEALLLFFFKGIFFGATSEMLQAMGSYSVTAESTFYVAFAILNLLIAATLIVAPFFAQFFLTGSGLTAAVFSFVGAGLAAAKIGYNTVAKPSNALGRATGALSRGSANTSFQQTMAQLMDGMNTPGRPGFAGGGPNGRGPNSGGPSSGGNRSRSDWNNPRPQGQGNGYNFTYSHSHNGGSGASVSQSKANPYPLNTASEHRAHQATKGDGGFKTLNPTKAAFSPNNVHSHSDAHSVAGEESSHASAQSTPVGGGHESESNKNDGTQPKKRDPKKAREGYFISQSIKNSNKV